MSRSTPTEPNLQRETAAEIERAAASWVARQDRGPLSPDEEQQLEAWASSDPRRAGAYARALATDDYLNRAAALGENFAVRDDAPLNPERRRLLAVAASFVAASLGGIGVWTYSRTSDGSAVAPIGTAKGATREVALQEGSRITLNTFTEVRPSFTSASRRVDLLHGEALFHVRKDPARPFIVYAGDVAVRAVGTAFSVRRLNDGAVRLLVTEGVVEVRRGSESLGRVHAGIEFAVDSVSPPVITNLNPVQLASALAWRKGRLDLQGLTLREAASEFDRYSDLKIRIDDPAVANLHIAGVFATNDPEGFAQAAALSLGLKAVRRTGEVALSRS